MTKEQEFKIMALVDKATGYNNKKELLQAIREHLEKVFANEMQTNDMQAKKR